MPKPIPAVLHISEKVISPNGDGVKDQTTFDLEIAEGVAWEFEIQEHNNRGEVKRILQRYTGTGLPSTKIVWEGEDDAGDRVSDGTYVTRWFTMDKVWQPSVTE